MQKIIVGLDGSIAVMPLTQGEIDVIQSQPIPIALPRSTSKYDLTLALFEMNLYDNLLAAVDAAGPRAQLQWEHTTIVSEDDPLVQVLITGLGWSDAIVDEIFDRIRNPSNYSEVA